MEAYLCIKTGYTIQELRNTPEYILDQMQFIWHLENLANKAQNRK